MTTRYLDQYGLDHYHRLIKTEKITATQAAASAAWTGAIDAHKLAVGKTIILDLPKGHPGGAPTLNLTLGDGTETGSIPVVGIQAEEVADKLLTDSTIMLFFDGESWRLLQSPTKEERTITAEKTRSIDARSASVITITPVDLGIEDDELGNYTIISLMQYNSNDEYRVWDTPHAYELAIYPTATIANQRINVAVINDAQSTADITARVTLLKIK